MSYPTRKYPDLAAWKTRFGDKAECVGLDCTCQRPTDSDAVEACVGCPYLVIRPREGYAAVVAHPEGVKP